MRERESVCVSFVDSPTSDGRIYECSTRLIESLEPAIEITHAH